LKQEKSIIFFITFVIVALASIYTYLGSKKYEVMFEIIPAEQSNISEMAFLDVVSIDKESLFSEVIKSLNVHKVSEKLSNNSDLLEFYEGQDKFLIMEEIVGNISVELPYQSKRALMVSEMPSVKLKVLGDAPEKAVMISRLLLDIVDSSVKRGVKENLMAKIKIELDDNQRAYDVILAKAKKDNEAEIIRISSKDDELRSEILEKIVLLRSKEAEELHYKIDRIKADLALAKSLNIVKPTDPLEYKKENKRTSQLSINGKDPLNYWKGSAVLEAELASLESRESNDAYIMGLSELNRQLNELKVNQRVELLKKRTDFVPFNEKLRQLVIQKTKLE
jgi:LPS O-antigen subunit length determinant protein (WzzB/FepE family)